MGQILCNICWEYIAEGLALESGQSYLGYVLNCPKPNANLGKPHPEASGEGRDKSRMRRVSVLLQEAEQLLCKRHLCSEELWRHRDHTVTAAYSCLLGVCGEAGVRPSDRKRWNWGKLKHEQLQLDKRKIGKVKDCNREFPASPSLASKAHMARPRVTWPWLLDLLQAECWAGETSGGAFLP